MDPERVVEVESLQFAYQPGRPVLADVTFHVHAGQLACIIGPNGGGKTTLLHLLLGLLRPDAGTLRVLGRPPRDVRTSVGYMPQHPAQDLNFPVSVEDVVLMGLLDRVPGGRFGRHDRDEAREAMREAGIEELRRRHFGSLSGGQRQRTLIARALASRPRLLLLDEPTSHVDPGYQDEFYQLMERLKARMAVIIVSHDLGLVSDRVESVICVNRSVRVHPTAALTGALIQELYGSRLTLVRHDHICSDKGHLHG